MGLTAEELRKKLYEFIKDEKERSERREAELEGMGNLADARMLASFHAGQQFGFTKILRVLDGS